jgi:hypothetical protein
MSKIWRAAAVALLISGVALAQGAGSQTTTTTTTTTTSKAGAAKKGTTKSGTSAATGATVQALQAHEQMLLDAYAKKQTDVFRKDLASNTVMIDESGVSDREKIISGIGSADCTINSATATDAKVVNIDRDSAVLYYTLKLDGKCGGNPAPAAVYASTVYSKRAGKWVPVFHQETLPQSRTR